MYLGENHRKRAEKTLCQCFPFAPSTTLDLPPQHRPPLSFRSLFLSAPSYLLSFSQFKEGSLYEIVGMKSSEGELVSFSTMVYAKGNVETWLSQIESMMRVTVLDQCKAAQKAFLTTPRTEWYWDFPAQVLPLITSALCPCR